MSDRHRWLEDVGFVVGIVNATLYTMGVKLGAATPETWAVVALNATLIAPKMLGRATAGRIWEKVAGRFGSSAPPSAPPPPASGPTPPPEGRV